MQRFRLSIRHLLLFLFLLLAPRARAARRRRRRLLRAAYFQYEKPKPPRVFKGPWGYNAPAPPTPIPSSPIADPFVSMARAGILKAVASAKKLGKAERDHAKKNLDAKDKERRVVEKALQDVVQEKRDRDQAHQPPPGLLDPDDGDDDPCPKDASGDTF